VKVVLIRVIIEKSNQCCIEKWNESIFLGQYFFTNNSIIM